MGLKPIDIYRAYPDNDVLGLEVTEDTRVVEIMRGESGDGLFDFLVRELCGSERDPVSLMDAINRLNRVLNDVRAVQKSVFKRVDEVLTQVRKPMTVEEINEFFVTRPDRPLCVYFMAYDDPDCGMNSAAFQDVAVEYWDAAEFTYFNVEAYEAYREGLPKPGVLPSFGLYVQGKIVWFHEGCCDAQTLSAALDSYLGLNSNTNANNEVQST